MTSDEPPTDAPRAASPRQRPLVLVVAAALVDATDRILVTQRNPGTHMAGLWEFPGGKVEPGELPEPALVRELHEELGVSVREDDLVPLTFVSHAYTDFHLLMPLYLCRRWEGMPRPLQVADAAFIAASDLARYAMPPADEPLRKALSRVLAS
jgi:8-oxo-dGTP diphosphatase